MEQLYKILAGFITTPISLITDPLGTLERHPLELLIWVGILMLVIKNHKLRKSKKADAEDKNKTNKLY